MITNKNDFKFRRICITTILLKSNIVKIDSADITSGNVFLKKKEPSDLTNQIVISPNSYWSHINHQYLRNVIYVEMGLYGDT